MPAPQIAKEIPTQVINERAAFGPFDLKQFVENKEESPLHFQAEVIDGRPLPVGLICTEDGLLTGIPGKNTQGNYDVVLRIKNEAGQTETKFAIVIKPAISGNPNYLDQLKAQVWGALEQNLPIPDLTEMLEREISPLEINYLLERWGALTVWDAFNLEPPSEKQLLRLEGTSPHYNIYDRGSSLIMGPKDLYSYERTLLDGLQTARVMIGEAYRRGWTMEVAGFDKLMRAAWLEVQHLNDQSERKLEIINYLPSTDDIKLYTTQAINRNSNMP